MSVRRIGNLRRLTCCLRPCSFHQVQPGAARSFVCNPDPLVYSKQALAYSRFGFLCHPTGPLSRSLLSSRSYKVITAAMASDFQSQWARRPHSEPPPKAPNGGKYKIAVCQLCVTSDKETNIANARDRIEAAADKGAQLIVLPEMWNCPISHESFPIYAEEIDAGLEVSPSLAMLADVARKKKVTIVGGSIPERSGGNLYNTCCVFDRNGDLKAKFRKVHLFDIDIPRKITFRESDTLTPGEGLCVVDLGAHIICYPGAFNMVTGPLHWELLQKARAVDNQIFVVTCSQARIPSADYTAWGHSTVVGPFGEILATTEHEEATIFADIDYSELDTRRQNMPLEFQRRGNLYHLTDVTRKELAANPMKQGSTS
nr:omega-amidase, chloroplastic-like isoform X3 [Physcomitrium patens]|eukprot:XP_024375429.1 omega-amidase, chloroplastic-like isoform X3 [Physcomitrella patens]